MSDSYNRHIMFSLGDMVFEYDEEKNQKTLKSMDFHCHSEPEYFLMTIESNWMMKDIVMKSSVMM